MTSAGSATRIDALTGVRIIAAGSVFLSHAEAPKYIPAPVQTLVTAGYNGVTLFFVLSGFVLAWSYADRLIPLRPRAVWSFFVARFARIYPLYLFALLFAATPQLVTHTLEPGWWRHVLAIQAWSPAKDTALNGPAWSIGVEFFLYACFPMVVIAVARIRWSPRALIAVGAVTMLAVAGLTWWFVITGRGALSWGNAGSTHRWLYRMPLTRLGDFTVGVIAALLVQSSRPRAWVAGVAQTLGVAGFVGLMAWPAVLFTAWSWDAAYLLPASLLLWGLGTGSRTWLARLLGTKPVVLAGEASFAFYLLHVPMLARLRIVGVETWRGWVFTTGLQFTVILLVAVGAHVVIELPAQRWLRRILDSKRAPLRDMEPSVVVVVSEPRHAVI